ncbi:MAG: ETC complex I subunit [Pseudomonadota bacterium]
MLARIYQPSKSAMTSGQGNAQGWVLEFAPAEPRRVDPLMGWTGSSDTRRQVKLRFDTRDGAIDYARRNGIAHVVEEPKRRKPNVRPMGYAANFAHNRRGNWTH